MITVVGSFSIELRAKASDIPEAGEAILGETFTIAPGGKGLGQAVAARRLGSDVCLVTKVGNDNFGSMAVDFLQKEGLNTSHVHIDPDSATGATVMVVDSNGASASVMTPGACYRLTEDDILAAEDVIAASDMVLLQLETNDESLITTVNLAVKHGVKVMLNPAPYREFPLEILRGVDYITPNRAEASAITGVKVTDDASALAAAEVLSSMGAGKVILTMSSLGSLIYENPFTYRFMSTFRIRALVDKTGVGDSFCGALAYAITNGHDILESTQIASAVAALCASKAGAAAAMPTLNEIVEFLEDDIVDNEAFENLK